MQNTSPRRVAVTGLAALAVLVPTALAAPAQASRTTNEVVYTFDSDNDGNYAVVVRDLLSGRVTTVLAADPEIFYDDPELSPDGTRIAFSTNRGSSTGDEGVAVVNRDGTGFERLTDPPPPPTAQGPFTSDVSAAWAPKGLTILFTRIKDDLSGEPNATTALFTVPAAGGAAAAVPGGAGGYTGDWSPDGKRIVFAHLARGADSGPITTMNPDGTGRMALHSGAVGFLPAWSPDGSTIAYSTITSRDSDPTRGNDVSQIATVPATGGPPRTLAMTRPTSQRTVAEYPAWSADGESIVFDLFGFSTADPFPPGDLWAVDRLGVRAGKIATTSGDEAQGFVHGPVPSTVSPGAPSTYTPVTPKRILDTRDGTGALKSKVGPAGTIALAVRGVGTAAGPVPATASAVVLNLTVTGPTRNTDVRAYPTGTPVPGASNVNAAAGQTVPNLVTVRIGDNGAITLRNAAGSTDLVGDIAGWYTPGAGGAGFAAVAPSRILDTRKGVGAPARKVGPQGTIDLLVKGGLPTADGTIVTVPTGARAVVLNVTATGPTAATNVRVYPTSTDVKVPTGSNLNVSRGQTTPNLVTVAVGQGGKVRLRNLDGDVHLIADLAGYYAPGATGRFIPVAPTRFLDTRTGVGAAAIPATAAGFADLKVAGARGVPTGATAAVLNLTGTGTTTATDVRAYPAGTAGLPTVSNLNLTTGVTRANLVLVRVGTDGRVRIRNAGGAVDLIGDLAGYMVG